MAKRKAELAQIEQPNHVEDWDKFIETFSKPVGSHGYDAWGFNIKGVKPFINAGKFLYEKYFRVEAHGQENVPKEGRCLIIANHSGQLPLDAMMLGYTLVTNPYAPRAPKGMMERFVPTVPFVSMYFNQWGGIVGDPENCRKLLENEECILVFPEGARGISKPWDKRYQLQDFGGGFMRMAMENKTPIIPVGIVGCEETIIQLANLKDMAKFWRMPAFPILVPFIFPSKVIINIGKPMYFEVEGDVREYMLEERVNQVKTVIEDLIQTGLSQREGVFSA